MFLKNIKLHEKNKEHGALRIDERENRGQILCNTLARLIDQYFVFYIDRDDAEKCP